MKEVVAYKTSDGTLFEDRLSAKKHAEKRYGDRLTRLAHRLVRVDKYLEMLELLGDDDMLLAFQQLKTLKEDRTVEELDR